ncbi:MAG: ArsR family transcriptional regulator [Methanobacteriota archaeon]|nr:MAG: ArsR family transcriptional regulator [Euryarchaeota archaeon]
MKDNELDISPYPLPTQDMSSQIKIEDLKGTTLRVYYFLAEKNEAVGPREIQRSLGLSSPSMGLYHLNRLVDANLVKKQVDGKYYIDGNPVRLGSLKDHVKVAGTLVPRILLYAYHALFSIFAAIFIYWRQYSSLVWLFYIIGSNLIFIVLLLYDARRLY